MIFLHKNDANIATLATTKIFDKTKLLQKPHRTK